MLCGTCSHRLFKWGGGSGPAWSVRAAESKMAKFEFKLPRRGGCRAWLAMAAAALAAHGVGLAAAPDNLATLQHCLPVRGTPNDGAPPLRLAPPPLSGAMGIDLAQSFFYRYVGAASGGGGSAGRANPLGKVLEPPPLTKALIDGSADLSAGRYAQAERTLSDCVSAAATTRDALAEAACANNLGLALAAQGRLEPARARLEHALGLYRAEHEPPRESDAKATNPIAGLLGLLAKAGGSPATQQGAGAASPSSVVGNVRQAALSQWRAMERIDAARGIERTSLNLGNVALLAGRLADAERALGTALNERPPGEAPQCRASAMVDWARLQVRLGRPVDTSLPAPAPDRARPGGRRNASRGQTVDESLVEMGVIHVAAASAGEAAAADVRSASGPASTVAVRVQSALAYSEAGGRFDATVMTGLLDQAAHATNDSAPPAEQAWKRLALRAAAGRRPDLEFAARVALMERYADRSQPQAAIYHAKRAINLAQSERDALEDRSPSRESRRAFARDRQQVYVSLAQMLLDAQRLQEAESVMQLLKEDEGQQFVDRPTALGRIELTAREMTVQALEDDAVREVRDAEKARVDAAGHVALGAGALRSMDVAKIESLRIEQALGLSGLPALLQRSPLPVGDGLMQQMAQEVRDFLLGPGRLERFVSHLQEDLPSFNTPVSATDRARLDDIARHLREIQADLGAALKLTSTNADSVGVSVSMSRAGSKTRETPPRQVEWGYAVAEIYERMWRSIHAADVIERRYAASASEADLPAQLGPSGRGGIAKDESKALLARQPLPTAALYYLPSAQRLDVLMVSASGRRHFRLGVGMKDLDASVDALIIALGNSNSDPRDAAQAMYRELFAPVEQAVVDSGARVLALSLSGRLRFVPFAAFHDGQGWLVERYAFAINPGARLAGGAKPTPANWRIAAFGASGGNAEFSPLLSVRAEIASVAGQGNGARGALPGDAWLDGAFTAQRLRAALTSGVQVVHIASHFKFVEQDAAASYLLLGDGSTLSLYDLAGPQYRFDRTELVTLSACATGLSSEDRYGQDVDGLAALLMGQGAPSVLASLWEVNDRSTAVLMGSLYRLHESQRLSRVVALQRAQLTMIHGGDATPSSTGGRATRSVTRVYLPDDPQGEAGVPVVPASAVGLGTAHPYHWAAFVLMGNWL